MIRIVTAATLIAALALPLLGVSAASAGGRSKDDRAAFWQTLHQQVQPWKAAFGMDPAPTRPAPGSTPAPANTAPANAAARPAG